MSPLKLIPLFLFSFIFFFSALFTSAQKKIITAIVKDEHSEEGIPFASVQFTNTNAGGLTDSTGSFTYYADQWPSDTVKITCVGYQPHLVFINPLEDTVLITIFLERGTFNEGAVVKAKVNKGLFIWRKIVEHKSQNDRYRYANFSCELHNKLEVDIKNLNFKKIANFKPFRPAQAIINQNIDSAEGRKYLPTYLTETLSDYYFQKKPLRRREIIKAANTNGIKNESVIKYLGGTDQVVNVYSNFIAVFDKEFVSPLSDNGDFSYNYSVLDTQQMGGFRFYHLVFTPRRKGTNTFEGDCWVHAGTFAIQKINLRLGKDANVNFLEKLSMVQEYKLINDSTWFLAKDKFVADVSPVGKQRPGFIGRKTTTYRNIVLNDTSVITEVGKNKDFEEIITAPGASERDKQYWDSSRHEKLTRSESNIIKMIDTLTNAAVFQRFTRTMSFIATGYLNTGNYQLGPWMNWVSSSGWEGLRIRFDLGTNKHFNKKIRPSGYLAYGFGDKKLKGKGEVFYLPAKHPRTYLYASYTNDLDFGQNYYGEVTQDNIFALAIRKKNIPVKNIKINEKRFEFFTETFAWMSNKVTVTNKSSLPLRNLLPADSFITNAKGNPLTSFEVSVRFRFAYLEDFIENTFYRTSLGSPYPIGEVNITHGFSGILKSSHSYTKVSASISDDIRIPPLGSISFQVYTGKTFGTLPYVFLDIAPGNELYYYNKYAFNMMNRYEFIHDRYTGITFEHIIGNGLFRFFPKLKLRQFWTAKALWGSLTDANKALNFKQGNLFQTLDGKTYLEMGTGVDNIFRVFRLDFVWRLLPASDLRETTKGFGIFGSFRLSF